MNLADYLRKCSPDKREALASAAQTTVEYLYQIAGGHRAAGPKLARRISVACDPKLGSVSLQELRPDIFGSPAKKHRPAKAEQQKAA